MAGSVRLEGGQCGTKTEKEPKKKQPKWSSCSCNCTGSLQEWSGSLQLSSYHRSRAVGLLSVWVFGSPLGNVGASEFIIPVSFKKVGHEWGALFWGDPAQGRSSVGPISHPGRPSQTQPRLCLWSHAGWKRGDSLILNKLVSHLAFFLGTGRWSLQSQQRIGRPAAEVKAHPPLVWAAGKGCPMDHMGISILPTQS